MIFDVDPALCEAVVEDAARLAERSGVSSLSRAIRRAIDPLYERPAGERAARFAAAYRRLFRDWGYEALLRRPLEEFPALAHGIERLAVRAAVRSSEAGADLGGARRAVAGVSLPAVLFRDPEALERFLRHELWHVADVLDPDFGYPAEACGVFGSAAGENAVRDRLRLLWSLAVDARIAAAGRPPSRGLHEYAALLARILGGAPAGLAREAAGALWVRPPASFSALLELARHPARLLVAETLRMQTTEVIA
jgi:hypothetical protein